MAELVWDIRQDTVPLVHSEEEVSSWIRSVLGPKGSSFVVESDGLVVGWLDVHDGWLDQLYCRRGYTGRGIGLDLLRFAKTLFPDGLQLYTFQVNQGARRFYGRHGFVEIELTDGAENEEKAPDVLLAWKPNL